PGFGSGSSSAGAGGGSAGRPGRGRGGGGGPGPGPPPARSGSIPGLFLQAAPGRLHLGLGGGAGGPGRVPDSLARLQLLVHGEEVVDLQPVVLGYVLELAQVLLQRISGRDTSDLIFTAIHVWHTLPTYGADAE